MTMAVSPYVSAGLMGARAGQLGAYQETSLKLEDRARQQQQQDLQDFYKVSTALMDQHAPDEIREPLVQHGVVLAGKLGIQGVTEESLRNARYQQTPEEKQAEQVNAAYRQAQVDSEQAQAKMRGAQAERYTRMNTGDLTPQEIGRLVLTHQNAARYAASMGDTTTAQYEWQMADQWESMLRTPGPTAGAIAPPIQGPAGPPLAVPGATSEPTFEDTLRGQGFLGGTGALGTPSAGALVPPSPSGRPAPNPVIPQKRADLLEAQEQYTQAGVPLREAQTGLATTRAQDIEATQRARMYQMEAAARASEARASAAAAHAQARVGNTQARSLSEVGLLTRDQSLMKQADDIRKEQIRITQATKTTGETVWRKYGELTPLEQKRYNSMTAQLEEIATQRAVLRKQKRQAGLLPAVDFNKFKPSDFLPGGGKKGGGRFSAKVEAGLRADMVTWKKRGGTFGQVWNVIHKQHPGYDHDAVLAIWDGIK